jgi:hypothetical protein
MNETELLNRLLIYFHKQQHSNMLLVQNLDVAFRGMDSGVMPNVNVERLCEQLYKDEFIYREVSYPNSGLQVNRYSICTKGIIFFNELPFEKAEEPYSYHLLQVIEQKKKQEEKEQLERDAISANISVSKSVEDTNTQNRYLAEETKTFYTKQTDYNTIQKGLTFVIFLAAAVQATIATCNYVSPKNYDKGKQLDTTSLHQRLEGLKAILQEKTRKDSIFQKAVKDSLKMK